MCLKWIRKTILYSRKYFNDSLQVSKTEYLDKQSIAKLWNCKKREKPNRRKRVPQYAFSHHRKIHVENRDCGDYESLQS